MTTRTKITNDKFSVRICSIASTYGFITIGSLLKFLHQCKPDAKLGVGIGTVRVASILNEVNKELNLINK